MSISIKKTFIYSFSFIILVRAMDGLPYVGKIPSYMTYVFCAVWGILLLTSGRGRIIGFITKSYGILLVLFGYFVLWGVLFFAPVADRPDLIHEMARRCVMIVFIWISVSWIIRYNCQSEIMHCCYIALLSLMLILFVLNIKEVHILRTVATFWQMSGSVRYRTLFSYSANNVAAELAMSVILLSFNELNIIKRLTARKIMIYFFDVVMFVIIVANNSRGTFIASVIMLIVYFVLKMSRKYSVKRVVECAVFVFALFVLCLACYLKKTGTDVSDLLKMINRQHLLANIDILNESGRYWLGLGNLSGGYFKNRNFLYGHYTDYMEMFYAGIYIRSGILGSIIILGVILYILFLLVLAGKKDKSFLSRWNLLVFSYMLLISLFEQYLFYGGYASSILFLTLILSYVQRWELRVRKERRIYRESVFSVMDSRPKNTNC